MSIRSTGGRRGCRTNIAKEKVWKVLSQPWSALPRSSLRRGTNLTDIVATELLLLKCEVVDLGGSGTLRVLKIEDDLSREDNLNRGRVG